MNGLDVLCWTVAVILIIFAIIVTAGIIGAIAARNNEVKQFKRKSEMRPWLEAQERRKEMLKKQQSMN